MPAPGTDVLPDASRFRAEASTTALKMVASAPGLQEDHMRFAPLLVVLACGCATSSSSGPPSGGTEPADARERGGRSPDSGPGAADDGRGATAGAVMADGGTPKVAVVGPGDRGAVSVAVATPRPRRGSKEGGTPVV